MTTEEIKGLRRKVDGIAQVVLRLKPIKTFGTSISHQDFLSDKNLFEVTGYREQVNSKEIESSGKNLLLAKAWLGNMLGLLGEINPYVKDNVTEAKDIPPTDDKVDITNWEVRNKWSTINHVERVVFLRSVIEEMKQTVSGWFPPTKEEMPMTIQQGRDLAICRTNVYNYLTEAKFLLGFELERLKNESEQPEKDIDRMLYGGIKQR